MVFYHLKFHKIILQLTIYQIYSYNLSLIFFKATYNMVIQLLLIKVYYFLNKQNQNRRFYNYSNNKIHFLALFIFIYKNIFRFNVSMVYIFIYHIFKSF